VSPPAWTVGAFFVLYALMPYSLRLIKVTMMMMMVMVMMMMVVMDDEQRHNWMVRGSPCEPSDYESTFFLNSLNSKTAVGESLHAAVGAAGGAVAGVG
jgi:hypothetical protein